MNSGGQPNSSKASRLLAIHSAQSGRNVVLCDTTGQFKEETKEKTTTESSGLTIQNVSDNMSVVTGTISNSFFTSKTFKANIKDLAERFDQVFISTSTRNAQLGLMALLEFEPGLSDLRLAKLKSPTLKILKQDSL